MCRFVPVSGLEGVNLMTVDAKKCPWYKGKSLIECLDTMETPHPDETLQNTKDVVMMVTDAYHGDYVGDCVAAKILRGFIDMSALKPMHFLPSKLPVTIRCGNRECGVTDSDPGEQREDDGGDDEQQRGAGRGEHGHDGDHVMCGTRR